MIGIGGCGMSGLARILQARGLEVAGSDATRSPVTDVLNRDGINVQIGGDSLPAAPDLMIASAAVPEDHPQRVAAAASGAPCIHYAAALGLVQQDRLGVSIAGTHGKSTTAAMLAWILIDTDLDPGFIIGAHCEQIGGGSRRGAATVPHGPHAGEGGILITEACEFNRSFHEHRPTVGLINNVEEDHLDIYEGLDEIVDAFRGFAALLPPAADGGSLLIAHDGARRAAITPPLACHVSTFGFHPEANYQVVWDASVRRAGILRDGMWVTQWTNTMPGAHNALNAAAAVILAHQLGTEWDAAADAIARFRGVDRRMERLGVRTLPRGDVTVYTDYGHHPTEIEKTLRSLRAAEDPRRLVCVFQPHQHSRTRFLLDQFAESFAAADEVIVPDIYFVRDSAAERKKVNAGDLVDRVRQRGVCASHEPDFDRIIANLEATLEAGDLLVVMGAGPVWTIARDFMEPTS
ncbi:MAG: UDP-N-acetylmuramate--L-alanine ligase [Phycisphaerales bacterium]|jgi:UDP-N-acetylmuramate--alanine ligase|nr:UDP-N-acetylmuramate--L-alanine ligase [Phycisphaerales bacterium]